MSEFQHRPNHDQNQSSDTDLTSGYNRRNRKAPQYSDASSQFSIEEILKEENEIFFDSERVDWESEEDAFEEELDEIDEIDFYRKTMLDEIDFYRKTMKELDDEDEIVSNSSQLSQYDDVSDSPVEQNQVASVNDTGKSSLSDKSNNSQVIKVPQPQPQTKTQKKEPLNVADLSAAEKLGFAMKRAALKLPKAVGEQLLAMITPASLAMMVGVLGAYVASHAAGIGLIADAVMLAGAGALIGWQAVSAAKDLWGFAQFINATTEEDLDKAGQHLANFVATVGIDIVLGILTKKAVGKVSNYVDDLKQVDEVSAHYDDIEYPEGISYRQDLPKHLRNFDGIGKNGIQGTHNLDVFNQTVKAEGIKIISQTENPTVKGIYQIKYQVPKVDKQLRPTGDYKKPKYKTVYDPAIHSDDKIVQLGQQAAAKGLDDAIANNNNQFDSTVEGITFRVYVDLANKTITNVHPK